MTLPDVETVSARVHEAWIASKHAQGVTSRRAETGEELMVPYEQLSETAKDLDRTTVQAVYTAIHAAQVRQKDDDNLVVPNPSCCDDCGLPYEGFPLDVVLPDADWLTIHPYGPNGLLCARCIVKRAASNPDIIILFTRLVRREDHDTFRRFKNVTWAQLDLLRAVIVAIVGSDETPLRAHNKRNECDWCGVTWTTPDWKLDPQPPMFGHPSNDCLVWLTEETT